MCVLTEQLELVSKELIHLEAILYGGLIFMK